MKNILLLIIPFCFCTTFAQKSVNYISYKKACNKAYIATIKDSNYQQAINHLEKVKSKFGFLASEEYMLKAFAYKQLNNSLQCAENVKLAWSNYSVDYSYLSEIPQLNPQRIGIGFNESENKLVFEGYDNFALLDKNPHADSIELVLAEMDSLDQLYRTTPESEITAEISRKIQLIDSLNGIKFKQIVLEFGFPGEQFSPGRSAGILGLILHFSDYPDYFEEMNLIFLNELKQGRMSPTYYLFWLDRHTFRETGKSLYAMYVTNGTKLDKQSKINKRRMKFGLNYGFPIPPKALSF